MNARFQKTAIKRRSRGFTLIEAMMGVGVLALFVVACFSGIIFNRIASMKAKEEAIAMDFLVHYVETIKALPFNQVVNAFPINPLFDGSGSSPEIIIPANNSLVALNTGDFEAFHPDLLWLHNRNPTLQVTLTTVSAGGVPHDKHLNVQLSWDAPLGRGGRQQAELDLVRTKDL